MKNKLIILSGGFDPVHKGHIRMFKAASKLGEVIIGLNSDNWLLRKKNKYFMSFHERTEILESIKYISKVIPFNDFDDTAINLIKDVINLYSNTSKIFFGNGGDRTVTTTPELDYCKGNNIEMLWNLGGDKIQSSSDLLKKW